MKILIKIFCGENCVIFWQIISAGMMNVTAGAPSPSPHVRRTNFTIFRQLGTAVTQRSDTAQYCTRQSSPDTGYIQHTGCLVSRHVIGNSEYDSFDAADTGPHAHNLINNSVHLCQRKFCSKMWGSRSKKLCRPCLGSSSLGIVLVWMFASLVQCCE